MEPSADPNPSLETLIDRALDAYAALAELGETIDEEWSYIQDLTDAWRTRLEEVATAGGADPPPPIVAAIDAAIAEVGLIGDAHRAIDWLSTFPQVVLVALGERA